MLTKRSNYKKSSKFTLVVFNIDKFQMMDIRREREPDEKWEIISISNHKYDFQMTCRIIGTSYRPLSLKEVGSGYNVPRTGPLSITQRLLLWKNLKKAQWQRNLNHVKEITLWSLNWFSLPDCNSKRNNKTYMLTYMVKSTEVLARCCTLWHQNLRGWDKGCASS